ncbi:MAG: tubulin-like doman-containing protein [Planctomycetaceae bacterium]
MAEFGFRGTTIEANKPDVEHVIPTLMIGLGGTGKQVVTRVRKRLHDKYGRPSFPFLRTIAFDTDVQTADSLPHDCEELDYANVLMTAAEGELQKIEIGGDGYNLARESFTRKNDLRYRQWMHPDFFDIVDETSVTQGSGACRQAGRLAFFTHYGMIQQVIDRELHEIRAYVQDRDRHEDGIPFEVDRDHIDVTIITSIAGGTGAGMFIDTAYLVKDILSSIPHVFENKSNRRFDPAGVTSHLTLIAVMPTAFAAQDTAKRDRFRLNAYASLLEMEHYNTARPDDNVFREKNSDRRAGRDPIEFRCNWNGEGEVAIPGRPWNTCYLIDDVNDKNRGSERKASDVQQMIADYLFMDIGDNKFATRKRSLRSNYSDVGTAVTYSSVYSMDAEETSTGAIDQNRELLYENRYGCSFSSFGLSEIYIDPVSMRKAASYRLAANLVRQRWLGNESAIATNTYKKWSQEDLFSPDIKNESLGYKPDDLIDELLKEEGKNWQESIRRSFDKLSTMTPNNTAPRDLLNKLYAALTTIRDSVDGTLPAESGTVRQTMEDRQRALRGHGGKLGLRGRLLRRTRDRINQVGLRPTLKLLEEYQSDLSKQKDVAANLGRQTAPTPEQIIVRLDDALLVPAPCRKAAVRIEFQKACEAGRSAAIQWCRVAAAALLDGIFVDALKMVSLTEAESLGKSYTAWRDFLDTRSGNATVCAELDKRFDQTRQQPKTDRRIPLLADWDGDRYDREINTELKDRNPDIGAHPRQVEIFDWPRAERVILTELARKWETTTRCSVIEKWYERRRKIATSMPEIVDSAKVACSKPLGDEFGLQECSDGNVAAELVSRDDCDDLLGRLVDASAPYLPGISYQVRKKIKVVWKNMIGVTDASGSNHADTIAEAIQSLSLEESDDRERDDFNPTSSKFAFEPAQLVLHRELRGIPVHFYDHLGKLHGHYHQTSMNEDRKTCHLSFRQSFGDLPDIKLIDADEYQDIANNVIDVYRGLLLGFISADEDGMFEVEVKERFMKQEIRLGTRIGRIVKHACCRQNVRSFLSDQWDSWEEHIADARHLAVLYNAIQQNMQRVVDAVDAGGDSSDPMTPPPKNCLTKLLNETEKKLCSVEHGKAYFELLRERNSMDPESKAAERRFLEISEHIRETCLKPAHDDLPILQVIRDNVKNVRFPIPEDQKATDSGPDTTHAAVKAESE